LEFLYERYKKINNFVREISISTESLMEKIRD
jgi:hypothetical protein